MGVLVISQVVIGATIEHCMPCIEISCPCLYRSCADFCIKVMKIARLELEQERFALQSSYQKLIERTSIDCKMFTSDMNSCL